MLERSKTLVVIPTYNEIENLRGLVERVWAAAPGVEILVVDDASTDGTGELADELSARHEGRFHVIHREGKLGMGTAYVRGFGWALEGGYGRVVQMDADGSHEPETLPGLLERLGEADLVIGSRTVPGGSVVGWGPHRLALSRAGGLYCRLFLGWSIGDPTSGYRALSRRALEVLAERPVRSEGFAFQLEVAYRVTCRGLRVVEYPICFRDRVAGQSKLSGEVVAEALVVVPLLRLSKLVGVVR